MRRFAVTAVTEQHDSTALATVSCENRTTTIARVAASRDGAGAVESTRTRPSPADSHETAVPDGALKPSTPEADMVLRRMLVLLLVGVPMLGMADFACAKTGIEVKVWDGTKRVEGAKVKVERVDPDGEVHPVTEATTGADGSATVEVDADTTYRITTKAGDREEIKTFETKGPSRDHTTMIMLNTQDTGLGHYMKVSTRLLLERARKAVAACDRKAYDDAVARIRA